MSRRPRRNHSAAFSAARHGLARYFEFYNARRPHQSHEGSTPDMIYFATLAPPTMSSGTEETSLTTCSGYGIITSLARRHFLPKWQVFGRVR